MFFLGKTSFKKFSPDPFQALFEKSVGLKCLTALRLGILLVWVPYVEKCLIFTTIERFMEDFCLFLNMFGECDTRTFRESIDFTGDMCYNI